MIVSIAFLGAPLANFSAERAVFTGILAISGHKFDADVAGIHADCTTFGTVVHAALTRHFHEAVLALYQARLAGLNTTFEFAVHKKWI
ncbi:hypothetical protein [Tunicatimonas pelagia]|uniref:hypothetical protein n=1 Tax=Tunicatimonas pelagia TaxID=931531 RepID=UPI0026652415|nr:hypothetical protein [Tunicatimonas pelagia]WKN45390.1 hypothetical protein P0M28_10520 [Tunicatimonas pelagia]